MRATVKGIYSTGLINLLLKEGFELTRLSDVQKERFNIYSEEQPDISIRDLKDRSGISVFGEELESVINTFKKHLWDSLYIKKSNKIFYVIFGGASKKYLDELRNEILPTIHNHHILRRDMSTIVDFSEILLNKELSNDILLRSIKEYIIKKVKDKGVIVKFHRKLSGDWFSKVEVIENIKLEENNKLVINTIRVPIPNGNYDGLNKPIEPGDYIKTVYIEDNWFFPMYYYDKQHNLKGIYYNINTPIEITTKKICYIDLCVDVVYTDSVYRVIDKEELKDFYNLGYITKKLYNKSISLVKELNKETHRQ